MEFIGYAVRRNDTGLFWNKHRGWNELPTIYDKKNHASCAGKYHSQRDKYNFIETVSVKYSIEILNN